MYFHERLINFCQKTVIRGTVIWKNAAAPLRLGSFWFQALSHSWLRFDLRSIGLILSLQLSSVFKWKRSWILWLGVPAPVITPGFCLHSTNCYVYSYPRGKLIRKTLKSGFDTIQLKVKQLLILLFDFYFFWDKIRGVAQSKA